MNVPPRSKSAAAAYPSSRDGSEGWSSAWSRSNLSGWGEHEPSVYKLSSRCSLPRSDSVVFRRRAQSSIGEACALMSHSHREVYMVDPIALLAKAANCPPALALELVKRKRCSEGTVNMGDVLRVLKTDDELRRSRLKESSPSLPIASSGTPTATNEEKEPGVDGTPPPALKDPEDVSPTPPPRTPPRRPPFPFHLRRTPEEKMSVINVTQFIPEHPRDESDDVLVKKRDLWSQTFSDDSLQWGEPCPPARRRRHAPVRFTAGSHGCLNLGAQPSKPTTEMAKSIDNMHLSSTASRRELEDDSTKDDRELRPSITPSPRGGRRKEVRLVEPDDAVNGSCELFVTTPVIPPRSRQKPRRPPPPALTASTEDDIDQLKDDQNAASAFSTMANKSPNLSTSSGLDISSDVSVEGVPPHRAKNLSRLSSSPDDRFFEVRRVPSRRRRRRKESADEDSFMSTASTPSRQRPRRPPPPPPALTVSDTNLYTEEAITRCDSDELIGRQTLRFSTLY